MSFILDALRKSENDRQRQASPNVSVATVGSQRRWQPGWIALVLTGVGAALLAVTIVWWFLAPVTPAEKTTTTQQGRLPASSTTADTEVRSLAQEARREKVENIPDPEPTRALREAAATTTKPAPPTRGNVPLTVTEAMAGGLNLPSLNLDIHVFAPESAERFVFINARKYRERETLREGPTVQEITSDGVILEFQGQRLLLPRD